MIRIAHSGPRLQFPIHPDMAGRAVYGLAIPMQVGPTTAALMVNLRVIGAKAIDMEAGTDIVLFDDLAQIKPENATPLDRNEPGKHPVTGEELTMVKYPPVGGFIPLGAKLPDGSPHPHAGTGFGLGQALGFPVQRHVLQPFNMHDIAVFFDLMQFRFDGKRFWIESSERLLPDQVLPGLVIKNRPLKPGVPDGADILTGMVAGPAGQIHGVGVTRWSRASGQWRPTRFTDVTGPDSSFEPSMIRDTDGALLLCARGWGVEGLTDAQKKTLDPASINRVQAWRSTDNGGTWKPSLRADGVRPWSPVCINQTADGRPFVAANRRVDPRENVRGISTPDARMREFLGAWRLSDDRASLSPESTLVDAPALFGPVPSGLVWYLDHPIGAVLTLAGGRRASVLAFRVADGGEVVRDARPTAVTGTWVEEVTYT